MGVMASLIERLRGASVMQRAVRASSLVVVNFASTQIIRLASNLILTRLLFPEAFGIMALASVFLTAMNQFSDIGVGPSIIRSKRGEDPIFLNTAWTLRFGRGIVLWLVATLAAYPMALLYNEPLLAQIIPVMAVNLILQGMLPTRIDLAVRNMSLGRLTLIDVCSSLFGVLAMIVLAYYMGSIWALPIGTVIGTVGRLLIYHFSLPGHKDSFGYERDAMKELVHFGKWIFPATIATFVIFEADKFLIARYVSLETLGIYNIGFFLASFPMILARHVGGNVMVSFFKNAPPGESRENAMRARKLLIAVFGAMNLGIILLVVIGTWVVDFLYDDRYQLAGIILVALTSMQMLQIAQMPYQNACLGLGRAKDYFFMLGIKAVIVVVCILVGLEYYGLLGGIVGQGVAMVIAHPFIVFFAHKIKVHDPLYDIAMIILALAATILAWMLYSDQIMMLTVY